jgi:uncharacterized repeat protein (TIGR01451 family)
MARSSAASRTRLLALFAVLTISMLNIQVVLAGAASAQNNACNGAFGGSPVGSLAMTANVPNGADITVGQSITVTSTWNTGDWSDLDQYHNCWQANGSLLGALDLFEGNPNNDGIITQTITVPNSLSAGDELCVRGRLSGNPIGGNTTTQKSNILCWDIVDTPGEPDVVIQKAASHQNRVAGEQFTYTLTARNTGNADATNVTITDTMPASLNIVSIPASCTQNGQTITCNVGTLAPNATASRTFTVQTTPASCPSVDNTGQVTASNEPQGNQGNNTSNNVTVNVTCSTPDVQVSKSSSAATVNANGSVTFSINATNSGGATANNVTITDTLASGLTITGTSAGCTTAGQTVTCNVGDLTAGQTKSVTITVTATAGACPSVQNQASVSAGNEPAGSTGNNNSNTVTLNVVCDQPDVEIRKASGAPSAGVFAGEEFTYTITVENVSSSSVTGVVIHDTIPAGLDIVSAAGCTIAGQDLTCNLGTLAAGAQESISVTVLATEAACPEVTNFATVTSDNDTNSQNDRSPDVTTPINCVEPGISVRIVKTNDANNDGIYSDSEEAKREGLDVPFNLVITNTGEETVQITDLTDSFDQETLDLLDAKCSQLDGVELAPGESVECNFTLNNYSPAAQTTLENTAEVCVKMVDGDLTDCDSDPSRVRSARVLGSTITPPPTRTPPGGTAFTGPDDGTMQLALLAIAALMLGTGVMFAGYRKRARYDG